jgi:hypothetical protein
LDVSKLKTQLLVSKTLHNVQKLAEICFFSLKKLEIRPFKCKCSAEPARTGRNRPVPSFWSELVRNWPKTVRYCWSGQPVLITLAPSTPCLANILDVHLSAVDLSLITSGN